MKFDQEYLAVLKHILSSGTDKGDRTGTGTLSVFAANMRFDLRDGSIPLLTSKRMKYENIVGELLWMLSGNTNVRDLEDQGIKIWSAWADENGDLGPTYGRQFRDAGGIDQLLEAQRLIIEEPGSRRIIISLWNVALLTQMRLPPCLHTYQFYVDTETHELNLHVNQRSCDFMLGVPYNIASAATFLRMMCAVSGYMPGELAWTGVDTHIYHNHIKQMSRQLASPIYDSPKLVLNDQLSSIDEFQLEDFRLHGYNRDLYPVITGDVAV